MVQNKVHLHPCYFLEGSEICGGGAGRSTIHKFNDGASLGVGRGHGNNGGIFGNDPKVPRIPPESWCCRCSIYTIFISVLENILQDAVIVDATKSK
jgi:hypothetical protein